uniref:Uncharacterized protein n=1 Tax=Vespula pensylvanica TaxID=30213 RepID=A0A834P477_VESPE|nr:hypothetical protein H0235_007224 [Vespula pensylvanica]
MNSKRTQEIAMRYINISYDIRLENTYVIAFASFHPEAETMCDDDDDDDDDGDEDDDDDDDKGGLKVKEEEEEEEKKEEGEKEDTRVTHIQPQHAVRAIGHVDTLR